MTRTRRGSSTAAAAEAEAQAYANTPPDKPITRRRTWVLPQCRVVSGKPTGDERSVKAGGVHGVGCWRVFQRTPSSKSSSCADELRTERLAGLYPNPAGLRSGSARWSRRIWRRPIGNCRFEDRSSPAPRLARVRDDRRCREVRTNTPGSRGRKRGGRPPGHPACRWQFHIRRPADGQSTTPSRSRIRHVGRAVAKPWRSSARRRVTTEDPLVESWCRTEACAQCPAAGLVRHIAPDGTRGRRDRNPGDRYVRTTEAAPDADYTQPDPSPDPSLNETTKPRQIEDELRGVLRVIDSQQGGRLP